mmetsp:Transcript_11854/g.21639  ORF Transcript_11854/g.21639 Transcript_11854/m.21639 type:complete len:363 (+) Transcript_11854:146-1234(+)
MAYHHDATVIPPPGLESFHQAKGMATDVATNAMEGLIEPVYLPLPTGYGEWERAVLDLVPHLNDAEGVRFALSILDKAYENACMAKRLEAAPYAMQYSGWQSMPFGVDQARAEVAATGQLLLSSLHQLQQRANLPSEATPAVQALVAGCNDLQFPKRVAPAPLVPASQPQIVTELAKPSAQPAWTEEGKQQRRKPKRQMQTLSSSLQILSKEDPRCLLIVRRISKLGFKALPILKAHFSAFGGVVRVLSAHSTVRQDGTKSPHQQPRRRPSSLGFVHMANPAAVLTALAAGHEQDVQGILILVEKFEQKADGMDDVDEEDATEQEWSRTTSCESGLTSTTAASSSDYCHDDDDSTGGSDIAQ